MVCCHISSEIHTCLLADPLPEIGDGDFPIGFGGVTDRIVATAEQARGYQIERVVSHAQDEFHVLQRLMKSSKIPVTSQVYAAIRAAISKVLAMANPAHADPLLAKTPTELKKKANVVGAELTSKLLEIPVDFARHDLRRGRREDVESDMRAFAQAYKRRRLADNAQSSDPSPSSNPLSERSSRPAQQPVAGQAMAYGDACTQSKVEHGVVRPNSHPRELMHMPT